MGERRLELQRTLAQVRRRWTGRTRLRAWTLGAAVATVLLLAGWVALRLVAAEGLALVVTLTLVSLAAVAALAYALWPLRQRPSDLQMARLVEERVGGLDDVLATAVTESERGTASPRMLELLAADATRALAEVNLDSVVHRSDLRKAWAGAAAATLALGVAVALWAPFVARGQRAATAYLFPARIEIQVTPGTTKWRAGQPLTIDVRLPGSDGAVVPALHVGQGEAARLVELTPAGDHFTATLEDVKESFVYRVSAARATSPDYEISVIRPARVERIDLRFDYPKALGLAARTEEDGGDIYGPAGTQVRLQVTTDKPISKGQLALGDGQAIPLTGSGQVLEGSLTIEEDGSYRVALVDGDGLESDGGTEYFIRTLMDRPPLVRIVRPGGDRQVTPLEEVRIEAEAEDDFGLSGFELVFQKPGAPEKALPLPAPKGQVTASAAKTLFLEELGVQPGDFVTYFARARDVGRGRRGSEARSDIFFLEVKPFEEEFVAAQSQMMGMQGGGGNQMQELAEAQKELIVATWKLDARARRARDARSEADVRALAKAQAGLKTRAEQAIGNVTGAASDPRRRRGSGPRPGMTVGREDPMALAVDAMGRATSELEGLKTAPALPHEMEALNQLLKAEAEIRRRQVARQQQAGGGGGQNRSGPDLSTLFDQELRKRQETNYETPNSSETREEEKREADPLDKVRELARRQAALNREQQEMARAQQDEAELKRQLERLTREQMQLRQEAEELARQMQAQRSNGNQQPSSQSSSQGQQQAGQQSQSGQGGGGGQSSQGERQLREISRQMREAANEMKERDRADGSAGGNKALEGLRDLEQQLQMSRPDDRRRAMGDLQLESRQLAEAARRLGREAAQTAEGAAGQDARRKLAGEQERLADRVERLGQSAKRLSDSAAKGERDTKDALDAAARDLDRERLAERMRDAAARWRKGSGDRQAGQDGTASAQGKNGQRGETPAGEPRTTDDGAREAAGERGKDGASADDMARTLDRVADRLAAAAGEETADARKLSDQLARTRELRDRVAELERSIQELQREGERGAQSPGQGGQRQAQNGQQGGQPGQGQQSGPQQAGQQGQQGQAGQQGGQQGQQGQSGQQGQAGPAGQSGQRQAQGSSQGQGQGGQSTGSAGGMQSGGPQEGPGGRLGEMQRALGEQMREAERMAGELRRDNPGAMQGPNTPEGWWPSTSAPGTEGFKQDFAKWESLKKNLLAALEHVETDVSSKLRDRENRERLNAGRHDAVPESYREQVDRYYRSLAAPRRTPQ